MSWQATSYVKRLKKCPDGAPLTRGLKLLLSILADYHRTDKNMAWPTQRTLAADAMTSERQVRRDLVYAEKHGLTRRAVKTGPGNSTMYEFVELDRPPQMPDATSGMKQDTVSAAASRKADTTSAINRTKRAAIPDMDDQNTGHGAQRNKEEEPVGTKDRRAGEAEEALPRAPALTEYATQMLEKIGLPCSTANVEVVEESIKVLVRDGRSPLAAYERLLGAVKTAQDNGEEINKFWFEDARWKRWVPRPWPAQKARNLYPDKEEQVEPAPQPVRTRSFRPDPALRDLLDEQPNPWKPIQKHLQSAVNPHSYDAWLKLAKFAGVDGRNLVLLVPSACFTNVCPKFEPQILAAAKELGIPFKAVEFVSAESAEEPLSSTDMEVGKAPLVQQVGESGQKYSSGARQ